MDTQQQQIIDALSTLQQSVDFLRANSVTKAEFQELASTVVTKSEFQELVETVAYIKDNAVMRDELHDMEMRLKTEIMTQIDSFIKLHQKLDVELVALRSKYERLEDHLNKVLKHLHLEPMSQ